MEKFSKFLLVLMLALASAAGAVEKFWLGCGLEQNVEIVDAQPTAKCVIYQGKTQPKEEYSWDGFAWNGFENWNDLVTEISDWNSFYSNFSEILLLGSDIEFDGYDESTKKCGEDYETVVLCGVSFDGQGKTIRNFCQVREDVAAFFSGFTYATVENVTFENAHVELQVLKNESENTQFGAIVAANLETAKITKVQVVSSDLIINSPDNANKAAYVGVLAANVSNSNISDNTVKNSKITGDGANSSEEGFSVGGLVGYFRVNGSQTCSLSRNDVAVQISLPYSNKVSVGGIAGFVDVDGSSSETGIFGNKVRPHTSINADNADDLELIYLTAESTEENAVENGQGARAGGIVGAVQFSQVEEEPKSFELKFNSVYGQMVTKSVNSASAIGGIIGYAGTPENVYSNSSIGSIVVPGNQDGNLPVGYIVGNLGGSKVNIYSNYHYGEKDANVALGVGYCNQNDIDLIYGNLNNYWHNYRNAIYDAKGKAQLAVSGTVDPFSLSGTAATLEGIPIYNLVLPVDIMRSRTFSYQLNSNGGSSCKSNLGLEDEFCWENDTLNNGLPYLTHKRTAYRIVLDIRDFIEPSEDGKYKNKVRDDLEMLKEYLYDYERDSLKSYYVVHTNREGKIPVDFMDAYEEEFKDRYSLSYMGQGAVLNRAKVYSPLNDGDAGEHRYFVMEKKQYKVEYDGLPENVAYAPALVESLDMYDPSKIIPVIYGRDKENMVYFFQNAIIACQQDEMRFENIPPKNILSLSEILVSNYIDDSQCESEPVLRLSYGSASDDFPPPTINIHNGEDKVRNGENEYVNSIPVKTALFARSKSGELVSVSDTSGDDDNSEYSRTIASEMEFFADGLGYARKFNQVDLWVCPSELTINKQVETFKDTIESVCKEYMSNCYEGGIVSNNHVGPVVEITNALDVYSVVHWTLTLDSDSRISLDSLLVATAQSDGNFRFLVQPKPILLGYEVTFMLPDSMTFYSDVSLDDPYEFSVNANLPRYIYNNDYCVAGWTEKNYGTGLPSDASEIHEDYSDRFQQLHDTGSVNLYPVLMPAAMCAFEVESPWEDLNAPEGYIRVVVEDVVGGEIRLLENKCDYDGNYEIVGCDTSVVHTFGATKQVLLNGRAESWILSFKAKDGFEAPETMLLSYDESRKAYPMPSEPLESGAELNTDNLVRGALLSGKFKMVNLVDLAFIEQSMVQSGPLALVKWTTSDFAAGRDAVLSAFVVDALGNVDKVKSILVEETPYADSLVVPVGYGTHIVRLELRDVLDSVVSFEQTFTVKNEIADAGKDVWQMVNLNAVNMAPVGRDDDQIIYRWDDTAEAGEFWQYKRLMPGNKVDPMGGYWYSSMEGRHLDFDSSFADSVYDLEWKLENENSGWNMVGNPHGWNVSLPESLEVVHWNTETAEYVPNRGYLGPFEGVWVRVEKSTALKFSGEPFFGVDSAAVAEKKRALPKARNDENWTIRAILADNRGKMDSWNILGMGRAQEGLEPPAGMGDAVSLSIRDGKKYLAKSVRPAPASSAEDSSVEWDLELGASSDRAGKLYFEGLDGISALGYHLYVTLEGRTTELSPGDTLPVGLKAAGSVAKVRVSKEKLYLRTALDGLKMVQSGNKLNVGFSATENLAGTRMVVDVLNMDGKVVSTIVGRAVSGSNSVSLGAPKSGLYMLRVRVASQQATGRILVK